MNTNKSTHSRAPRVIVATTVALAFISVWRASAVVLSDLASTMFYAGGIAEEAVGPAAPWFVLAVMFFSFAVRAIYMESCGMYVRGGVYAVVRDSMGPRTAKLSVSALIFDYLLTGPISGVSAGQYVGRLFNEISELLGYGPVVDPNQFSMFFAVLVTGYFWWLNTKGIHESSSKALRIMQVTTLMVVVLIIWCLVTLSLRGPAQYPPPPLPQNLDWGHHSLGWLEGTFWPQISALALVIAFGHSFLSMSGFETLAQVYREIAYPKLKNLRITGFTVCTYALLSTGLITLLASMVIPDAVRHDYVDNLIGGLVMNLEGPVSLKLAFHAFVVLVGGLILSGAVNTSIIGANSVLNRVAEDGVLLAEFRRPHIKYGTTYRIINSVVALQIVTILLSGGDVYLLGEAYAFGVVWSFALKATGVLVLRFQRSDQQYKVPFNFYFKGREIPAGLIAIQLALLMVAVANLFTKQHATIYGISFTLGFFLLFNVSERINQRRRAREPKNLEEFNLESHDEITPDAANLPKGATVVAVRDYNSLRQLEWVLHNSRFRRRPVVVLTVRPLTAAEGEYALSRDQVFSLHERELLSRAVSIAEKAGRTVNLLVVPAVNYNDALVRTVIKLDSQLLVLGASPRVNNDELARRIGLAWERLQVDPKPNFQLVIVGDNNALQTVAIGPHSPRLWPEDVERVHGMWLELADKTKLGSRLHHRDVISLALNRLERDLKSQGRDDVLKELKTQVSESASER